IEQQSGGVGVEAGNFHQARFVLFDGKDGKLVWRGSGEQIMRTSPPSPAEREQAIRETVQKVMSQYPPR
ncbi:DUF4136 domain-containing protein, partial [Pseudomonas aeruginosa]|uniref:DUF4136 domain-containing protein n=1 Tax=Pseudomonas aeruginosa TaxID=287 RepID=UPI001CDA1D40